MPARHTSLWPDGPQYMDAVLDPANNFMDADLRQAEPVCDEDGLPLYERGASGVVFRLQWPNNSKKDFAVKCFWKPDRGRQERYRLLSRHLRQRPRPYFMVDFRYLRDQEEEGEEDYGILINDEWFPVLKMDWVEGQTLREIVEDNLNRKGVFHVLCRFWEQLAQQLNDADLAHLDLQHGNVKWLPGSSERKVIPKLIDYDGMWTPTLAHLPTKERGVAHYQHPERYSAQDHRLAYRPEADRFSHLVIYTALRSLAVLGPELWRQYDNGDNLLFTREDFEYCRRNGAERAPSKLLHQLWAHHTDELKWLAGRLILAAKGPLEEVPLLHEVVSEAQEPLDDEIKARVQKVLGLHVEAEFTNGLGMKFVRVPKGKFWMSEKGQNAQREVEIGDDFRIGVHQVTQEQWQAVMGNNPSHFKGDGRLPVESVSWDDAQQFIAGARRRSGAASSASAVPKFPSGPGQGKRSLERRLKAAERSGAEPAAFTPERKAERPGGSSPGVQGRSPWWRYCDLQKCTNVSVSMAFKFFIVPIQDSGGAEAELNGFLRSHRVLGVDRRWVEQGSGSFWCFCVDYLDGTPGGKSYSQAQAGRARVDYREVLSPEQFAVFAKLRDLRKEIAQREAVPVYTIFTNDQLAQMVQTKATTKPALEKIADVGDARIEKYGPRMLELLSQTWKDDGEAKGKPV